jgi:hypothetical protein
MNMLYNPQLILILIQEELPAADGLIHILGLSHPDEFRANFNFVFLIRFEKVFEFNFHEGIVLKTLVDLVFC